MTFLTATCCLILLAGTICLLKNVDDLIRRRAQKAYIRGALREQTLYALSTPVTDAPQVRIARPVEPVAYLEDHRLSA